MFRIETYGCSSNKADSQVIAELLCSHGYAEGDGKDVLTIVNTCVVTSYTEKKVLKRLFELEKEKRDYVVAGCLPAARPELLGNLSPVGVITPSNLGEIVGIVERWAKGRKVEVREIVSPRQPRIINVGRGCVGECTYCIVKRARGEIQSVSPSDIVDEIRKGVRGGVREFYLTSQDMSAYGIDIGLRLPDLLHKVTALEGDYVLRVGMMNPKTLMPILERTVESMRGKVYRFAHVPVQSGSDKVLELMGRGYTVKDFERIVSTFQKHGFSICTDVIVGFPGEEEEDFEDTLQLINRIKPDKLNITRFSPRPHTKYWGTSSDGEIKKERSRLITKMYFSICEKRNRKMVGKRMRVLVTERVKKDSVVARDPKYTNVVVKGEFPIWSALEVEVVGYHPMYLIAEPLDAIPLNEFVGTLKNDKTINEEVCSWHGG
jgi:MiaB-like tRNA modifying enzyme